MRLSKDFFYTIKENVADEDSVSGNLLVRSGMIEKIGNGIYAKMPLGKKTIKNIENIVRKYMDEVGANELSMPSLLPMEVFERAGRKAPFPLESGEPVFHDQGHQSFQSTCKGTEGSQRQRNRDRGCGYPGKMGGGSGRAVQRRHRERGGEDGKHRSEESAELVRECKPENP